MNECMNGMANRRANTFANVAKYSNKKTSRLAYEFPNKSLSTLFIIH